MKLYIIHLTDIHLRDSNDLVLSKADELVKACSSVIQEQSDVIVTVTGDMAAAGKPEQYALFNSFITKLSSALEKIDYVNSVRVFTVPGNHDCDFTLETSVRKTIIRATNCRDTDNYELENVEFAVKQVQTPCFSCTAPEVIGLNMDNYLYQLTDFAVGIGKITILQLNTAWISTLREEAAKMCMPINLLPEVPIEKSDLIICMMHHPMYWFHPDNKAAFESFLRKSVDIVLCGHEHMADEVSLRGDEWNYQYLEGRELQAKPDEDTSGFSVYILDETLNTIGVQSFSWEKNRYKEEKSSNLPFTRNCATVQLTLRPNSEMLRKLSDLGAIIHHPQIDELLLDDLFIWPDLEESHMDKAEVVLSLDGEQIYERLLQNRISVFYGGETSGKTSLAKQFYKKGVNDGKCCLLCSGTYFKARKRDSILRELESLFIDQYSGDLIDKYKDLDKNERIIIIDDYEQIVYNNEKIGDFFRILMEYFGTIILLTESDGSAPFILSQFSADDVLLYRIRPFGNRKRGELIQKWYSLGNERIPRDPREMDVVVDNATRVVNGLLGSLTPIVIATPLTVLSVLQTIDATGTTVINGQSYAYERLVRFSLDRLAEGSQAKQNIFVSILSNLAYRMLVQKKWAISSEELIKEISDYSRDKLLGLNVVTTVGKIVKSRMLVPIGEDSYMFRYPYLYYYFCGLYIAKNVQRKDVQTHIDYMASRLHIVEYGNIMIFICHFLNNEEILQSIIVNALYTMEDVTPFDFARPYSLLDEVYADVKMLLDAVQIGNENDVDNERKREQEFRDEQQIEDGTISSAHSERIEDDPVELGSIISALRIIDVLGQILRNYPGDISGENKKLAIEEVKELSMKMVGMMYDGISGLKDEILSELVKRIREKNPSTSDSLLEERIKQVFNGFVFSISGSMVQKASMTLAAPLLLPAVSIIQESNRDDIAMGLIAKNAEMLCLAEPDYDGIIAFNKELRDKNLYYAQETLRMLVAQHLRRRHCGETVRDRLCTEFSLQKNKVLPPIPLPKQ